MRGLAAGDQRRNRTDRADRTDLFFRAGGEGGVGTTANLGNDDVADGSEIRPLDPRVRHGASVRRTGRRSRSRWLLGWPRWVRARRRAFPRTAVGSRSCSNLSGLPQVWTVAAVGGWPEPATALDDPVGSVWWSPAGDRLAFTLAPGGGMNAQVYTVRPDGTQLRRLTDGGKATNDLGGWSHDGGKLMVASNRRTPASMDAYLVDPDSGEWQLVAEVRGTGGLVDVSRDGRFAVINRLAQRGSNNLGLVNLRGGPERAAHPARGAGQLRLGRLRARSDGRSISRPIATAIVPPSRGFASTTTARPARSKWSRPATTPNFPASRSTNRARPRP